MLYSQQIKNLVSGISQQPPLLRLPEQLAVQENGLSTEARGLQKRPPTVYVSDLSERVDETQIPLIHFVNRDERERYIMYFYDGGISILNLQGSPQIIERMENRAYLQTQNPRRDLRVITIADHTFILNRSIKVRMTRKKSPKSYEAQQGALVHVKQGQYGRSYRIWDGDREIAAFDTPDGSDKSHTSMIDTHYIATQLADAARKAGYAVDVGSTWLRIHGVKRLRTQDGFNNQAMIGTTGTIQKFSLLPADAPGGYVVRVTGDPGSSGAGSYYVMYSNKDNVWVEFTAPDIHLELDAATMPHILVRETNGKFTFKPAKWAERKVGDEDSNPLPSFVGQTLNDIFFYRNRLGFLSGENIILSESGEYFNFWMTTANDILDTDCIDVPTTTTRINILNYAVPFQQSLYCFSDSTQFMLSSDTVLSPKNCALVEVTGFHNSPACRPVAAGKNLYFPAERAEYASIKEYYSVQDIADVKNAQDITSHIPSYIPNGVYQIITGGGENLLLFLTEGDNTAIYVYKYLFQNEQRVQASWSRWTFGARIYGAFFIASTLYLLMNRGDRHVLERMDFTDTTKDFSKIEPYRVYLDSKTYARGQTPPGDPNHTRYHLHAIYPSRHSFHDIKELGYVLPNGKYRTLPIEQLEQGASFKIPGNWEGQYIIIGIPYTFQAELSPIYIRQEDSKGGTKAITNGRLQIRSIDMNYADTGAFVAKVKSHNHTYTYTMTNKEIGQTVFGETSFSTGTFRIPVQSLNTAYKLTIESDMPFPVSLIGCMWKGSFVPRTRGV